MLSERVKAGIVHARANGKPHGRPKTAILHRNRIIQMDKEGYNKSQIAKEVIASQKGEFAHGFSCNSLINIA